MPIVTFNETEYPYELLTGKDSNKLIILRDRLNDKPGQMIAFDLETNGLDPFNGDRLTGMSLYFPETNESYYLSFRHPETDNLSLDEMRRFINALLANNHRLLTWNGKFDLRMLSVESDLVLKRGYFVEDGMIAVHLVDENRRARGLNYKLKDVANHYLGADAADEQKELKQEIKKRKLEDGAIGQLPAHLVAGYAVMDVILTYELRKFFMSYLEKWEVTDLFFENTAFFQYVLLPMEIHGMPVDRNKIEELMKESVKIADALKEEIIREAGFEINLNSPKQLVAWLGTENAQQATLEYIGNFNPVAKKIATFKLYDKINGTYYGPYLRHSAGDGRLHPSFNITGTVTGRLSGSDPNPQNIPRKSDTNRVKEVFVAPDGWKYVNIDYKQLELRLACHFSGEPTMTEMFLNGEDMHQYTADALGVSRHVGKTANFGLLYGMGHVKAAPMMGLSLEDANKVVNAWRKLYPAFKKEHKEVEKQCQEWRTPSGKPSDSVNGYQYYRLPDGRCRHVVAGYVKPFDVWNSLVQGTGAAIARKGIMRVMDTYPDNDWLLPICNVHDAIVFLIRDDKVDELKNIAALMTDFPEYSPPMEVDVEIGQSWGKLTKVKF